MQSDSNSKQKNTPHTTKLKFGEIELELEDQVPPFKTNTRGTTLFIIDIRISVVFIRMII